MHVLTERIPLLISVIYGATVLASISFDYGYFLSLDINFSTAPTSISDHLRNSLIWIPNAAAIFTILPLIHLISKNTGFLNRYRLSGITIIFLTYIMVFILGTISKEKYIQSSYYFFYTAGVFSIA
jgi:hypothetical protein